MFLKIVKSCLILCTFAFIALADQHQEEENLLSRQKRFLVFEPSTVWQLSMALVSKIAYVDSHRVAINSGFNVNYNLPTSLANFYKPTYFRSLENSTSPIFEFIKKFAESNDTSVSDLTPSSDDEKSERRNNDENRTNENLEADDDNEVTTTETETTTKKLKKKKKPKVKRDLTAAELYSGLKDTLKVSGYHEDCLLKSICELARHPLTDHDNDLVYEILHFVLTPSVHQGFDSETEVDEQRIYEEAETIGNSDGDCELFYSSCESSPLNSISQIMHEDFYD
ncbi:hypothetical protein ACKWTF_003981 [Chironomus riparius]